MIFKEILENKIEPDQVLSNKIIKICIFNRKLKDIFDLLKIYIS